MSAINKIRISLLIISGSLLLLVNSCKKEDTGNNYEIVVTTLAVADTSVTKTTAICGGKITANANLVISVRGVCWSKDKPSIAKPLNTDDSLTTDGAGTGEFTSFVTGLKSGVTYYIRAYATYYVEADSAPKIKTSFGKVLSFNTAKEDVYTTPVTSRTQTSATCGGIIISGTETTTRGICWSNVKNPTIADNFTNDSGHGLGSFTITMTGLIINSTYYARAFAGSGSEPIYGNEIIVQTLGEPVDDNDGNTYNTISIGNQVWMVENLKTTRYNDGKDIPLVTDNILWYNDLKTPAYCWYNNDISFKAEYGALYDWYTVNTGKLCPDGWRVPSDSDWKILTANLDGEKSAGGKLKEAGTDHWLAPNDEASNESGFTGLPGGGRNYVGSFDDLHQYGYYWTSTEAKSAKFAWFRYLTYEEGIVVRDSLDKRSGVSVRCIKE